MNTAPQVLAGSRRRPPACATGRCINQEFRTKQNCQYFLTNCENRPSYGYNGYVGRSSRLKGPLWVGGSREADIGPSGPARPTQRHFAPNSAKARSLRLLRCARFLVIATRPLMLRRRVPWTASCSGLADPARARPRHHPIPLVARGAGDGRTTTKSRQGQTGNSPAPATSPLLENCNSTLITVLMETATLGTLLRHLIELLDGAVADAYRRAAPGYRPRFTPVIRALLHEGPLSITQIKRSVGASHSAISQTVAEMVREDLVVLEAGQDQRERIIDLTPKARQLLPILEAQWACTECAARSIDADLGMSLADVLRSAIAVLEDKPFAIRIAKARQALGKKT